MRSKADLIYKQYKSMVSWVNMHLNKLTDDDLKLEVAPRKNHGIFILGHLIASDDDLSLYLGKGPLLYPEYDNVFTQGSSLKPFDEYPPASILREHWKNVTDKNKKIYEELSDEELSEPHVMIKGNIEDDYFKTKEIVSINWLLHQMYHAGQLSVIYSLSGKKRIA